MLQKKLLNAKLIAISLKGEKIMRKIIAIIIAVSCVLGAFSICANAQQEQIERTEKTSIGAIYYHNWFETFDEWWKYDNEYADDVQCAAAQEARCLSPKQYHYRLPFFATVNTAVTSSTKINGDLSAGVAEFPEFTKEIWTQEMEYACEAGINFMAYLWSRPEKLNRMGYMYHIETKGLDGKIKMAGILQDENRDIPGMAKAMTEDFWYTVNGRPVVYIYNAPKIATKEFIDRINSELALAQKDAGKEVTKAYIVGLGVGNKEKAEQCKANGVEAISWYAFSGSGAATQTDKKKWDAAGTKIREMKYYQLSKYAKESMEYMLNNGAGLDVMPTITLGYNTMPRIDNPVRWFWLEKDEIAYNGYTISDPTAKEITKNVLDILNFNKLNYKKTISNTVLMYAWNEYDEGGWIAPTLAVDENGNVLKNEDGTNKINRENLDAVKKGIELYRKHEDEAAVYDINDKLTEFIYYDKATPKTTLQATQTPDNIPQDEERGNGWVLWVSLGGAVVVATAVVVVVVLKKKKAINAE